MPLDRLIRVISEAPGTRNQYGESVPGAVTRRLLWATRMDRTLTDIAEEGGQRTEGRRDYRIRWIPDLRHQLSVHLSLMDGTLDDAGEDVIWTIDNIVEVTGRDGNTRRRFLDFQCTWAP